MSQPNTPIDVYKAIIDQLVRQTRTHGPSARVADTSLYPNAFAQEEYNEFVCSLSEEQRNLLSRMLQDARDGAIHDVLAELTWWIDCHDVGLTYKGKRMPVQLSGMGLHGDYIGRLDDWNWPNTDETHR